VKSLLKTGQRTTDYFRLFPQTNKSPLHISAKNGHLEVLKVLIECVGELGVGGEAIELKTGERGDFESKSEGGATPLFLAVANGHLEIVELLLECGASVMIPNFEGTTPLFHALTGHLEISRELISNN
jgi:ankyrin repeat protein